MSGTQERLRREYRAFVRASHPDRGGDPELFASELRRWQAALDPSAGSGGSGEPRTHRVTAFRRGPWPVRCGRALAAAVRRRRRTRVR